MTVLEGGVGAVGKKRIIYQHCSHKACLLPSAAAADDDDDSCASGFVGLFFFLGVGFWFDGFFCFVGCRESGHPC